MKETKCSDFTVFILSYNRPSYLKEAIQSVLVQELPPRDIIVLDNGSSLDIRERINEELNQGVKFIGADINHPFSWNFLRAINMAETKYFLAMHDDDRLLPNFISKMSEFLEINDKIIAVACNAHIINDEGKRTGRPLKKKGRLKVQVFSDSIEMAKLYSRSSLPFPTVVYRTGFPDHLQMRNEFGKVNDSIFLCELASFGPIAYLDEEYYEYRRHSGQDSSYFPFKELMKRNDWLLEKSRSNNNIYIQVKNNISKSETQLSMDGILLYAIRTKSLQGFSRNIETYKTNRFKLRFLINYFPTKILDLLYDYPKII